MTSAAPLNLAKWLPNALWNVETQTVVLTVLSFIGAWVVVSKILQFLFFILWPLIVVAGVLLMMPNISYEWANEFCPIYVKNFMDWLKKIAADINLNVNRTMS